MKKRFVLPVLFLLAATTAAASSIGFNLEGADLVVAGTLKEDGPANDRFEFHRIDGIDLIHGDAPEGPVRVLCPRDLCYHVHVAADEPTLLFLRRMEIRSPEGNLEGPFYMALASPMSAVPLVGDEGNLILEAVRAQAAAGSDPARRAAAVARVLSTGLEPHRSTLLQSALIDSVRTPGALDGLDSLDRTRLLQRFRDVRPGSDLQHSLLGALGCVKPDGLTDELIRMVRGAAGIFHREQIAAILAAVGDETVPFALAEGFTDLNAQSRANVLRVLGSMGRGKGVAAIRSVMWCRKESVLGQAAQALFTDRSKGAVDALGEIVRKGGKTEALSAVAALASINTEDSRSVLYAVRRDKTLDVEVRRSAAQFLIRLAKSRTRSLSR